MSKNLTKCCKNPAPTDKELEAILDMYDILDAMQGGGYNDDEYKPMLKAARRYLKKAGMKMRDVKLTEYVRRNK